MANNTTNVSVGKPAVAGAIWSAPLGATLPTNATAALDEAFVCMGYVSEDGLRNTNSPTSETIKAWGGDTVATVATEKLDQFKFKMIEALNVDVLRAVYGSGNVSGTLAEGVTVRANSSEVEARAWVYETIMTNGTLKRIVVPNGKISEVAEIVYKDNEAVGYDVTINALPGDEAFSYDTHKEYIQTPAGSAATETGEQSGDESGG